MNIPEFDDLVTALNEPVAPKMPEEETSEECSSEMQVLLNILETVTRIEVKLDGARAPATNVSPEIFSPTLEMF